MMKSKRAWIRIIEATIGVLLLASVLFIMIERIPNKEDNSNIKTAQRQALEAISKDSALRADVLGGTLDPINSSIRTTLSAYSSAWAYDFRICNVDSACGMEHYPGEEVYADEILISSTLEDYSPKKLRLFVWRKS
jgi:hypothetical protein